MSTGHSFTSLSELKTAVNEWCDSATQASAETTYGHISFLTGLFII